MKNRSETRSRRTFLRAAGACGLVALGGEAALGRSLIARAPAAQDGGGCECTLITHTITATGTLSYPAGTMTATFPHTGQPTSGTLTISAQVNPTASVTYSVATYLKFPGSVTLIFTEMLSAAPLARRTWTYSFANGVRTITQSQDVPYTLSRTVTRYESWWVHCDDCEGDHGNGDDSTGGRAKPFPVRSTSRGDLGPLELDALPDVLDVRSRADELVFPRLD